MPTNRIQNHPLTSKPRSLLAASLVAFCFACVPLSVMGGLDEFDVTGSGTLNSYTDFFTNVASFQEPGGDDQLRTAGGFQLADISYFENTITFAPGTDFLGFLYDLGENTTLTLTGLSNGGTWTGIAEGENLLFDFDPDNFDGDSIVVDYHPIYQNEGVGSIVLAAVPEPSSFLLSAMVFVPILLRRRR